MISDGIKKVCKPCIKWMVCLEAPNQSNSDTFCFTISLKVSNKISYANYFKLNIRFQILTSWKKAFESDPVDRRKSGVSLTTGFSGRLMILTMLLLIWNSTV